MPGLQKLSGLESLQKKLDSYFQFITRAMEKLKEC